MSAHLIGFDKVGRQTHELPYLRIIEVAFQTNGSFISLAQLIRFIRNVHHAVFAVAIGACRCAFDPFRQCLPMIGFDIFTGFFFMTSPAGDAYILVTGRGILILPSVDHVIAVTIDACRSFAPICAKLSMNARLKLLNECDEVFFSFYFLKYILIQMAIQASFRFAAELCRAGGMRSMTICAHRRFIFIVRKNRVMDTVPECLAI